MGWDLSEIQLGAVSGEKNLVRSTKFFVEKILKQGKCDFISLFQPAPKLQKRKKKKHETTIFAKIEREKNTKKNVFAVPQC